MSFILLENPCSRHKRETLPSASLPMSLSCTICFNHLVLLIHMPRYTSYPKTAEFPSLSCGGRVLLKSTREVFQRGDTSPYQAISLHHWKELSCAWRGRNLYIKWEQRLQKQALLELPVKDRRSGDGGKENSKGTDYLHVLFHERTETCGLQTCKQGPRGQSAA